MSSKQNGVELKTAGRSELLRKLQGAFSERPIEPIEVEPSILRRWTRRDLLLFGAGAFGTLAVGGSQLPREVLQRLALDRGKIDSENKWLLNQALRLDDNVSATLYSLFTRPIIWSQPTPNHRLLCSRTTTTEQPPTPAIFQNGV
jgi:hypothetical protein